MTLAHEPSSSSAWLGRIALALAIAIVVARCLMSESVRDTGFGTLNAPAAPGVTTSLVLDWLSGIPAMLVLVRRLVDRSYTLRWSWAHGFLISLGLWALVSTMWADDRFLALTTSTRLLAAGMLFWAFAQLVRRWDHLRVIAGVLVGLLLANLAQGLITRHLDQPDLHNYWRENKAQILAEHHWQEGDYFAVRFEKKLLAGEIMGFNVSPNTLGAIVVMMSLVAVGCAAQRIGDKDEPGWAGVLVLTAAASLYLLYHTGSKASSQALLLGLCSLAIWRISRRWLASHRALVFAVGIASVLLAVAGVIALGLSSGGLPSDSLNFRWRYWIGAWPLFFADPILGIGWNNFADHYLATRLPEAAEEINDPHNLFVKLSVELGVIGLALGAGWMLAWAWRASRLTIHLANTQSNTQRAAFPATGLIAAGGLTLLVSIVAAIDFGTEGGGAYVILEVMKRALLVGLVALGVGLVSIRSSSDSSVDPRPAPWIAAALFIAVAMLVIQSSIDIAFFQTGPLMLATMTMGALAGIAGTEKPARRDSLTMIGLSFGLLLGLVLLVAVVVPVGLAEHKAAAARSFMASGRTDLAARNYAAAFDAWLPIRNADYALDAASAYANVAISADGERRAVNLADAARWFDNAIDANPNGVMARVSRARFRAGIAGDESAIDAAVADFDIATKLNPNDVELRIEFADVLERFGRPADAAHQLSEALTINDQFDPREPERIELQSPARLADLQARLARLQAR